MQDMDAARQAPAAHDRRSFGLGLKLGVLAGALLALAVVWLSNSVAPEDLPGGVRTSMRWFIWQGSGPLVGQPFSAEEQCEEARKEFVAGRKKRLEDQARQTSRMTIDQAIALDESPERLLEEATKLDAAYCRALT